MATKVRYIRYLLVVYDLALAAGVCAKHIHAKIKARFNGTPK